MQFTKPLEKPFYIHYWAKKLLILPPKYLDDIRRARRDHLSFQSAINDMLFQYKWIGDGIRTELNQVVIIKGLNPQLRTIHPVPLRSNDADKGASKNVRPSNRGV
jgi:hypothetical protein